MKFRFGNSMAKKQIRRKKKQSELIAEEHLLFIERILKISVLIVFSIFIIIISYYFGFESGKNEVHGKLVHEKQARKIVEKTLQKLQNQTAAHEIDSPQVQIAEPEKNAMEMTAVPEEKPLMAIIIDDVSFKHDIRNIEATGIPVTMSFLPPSARHPNSAALAQSIPHYMVHLPLQATNFKHEESNTLHIGDSEERIEDRIRKITELYPKVRFINNHTGSLFTEDFESMHKLIEVLDRYGITFVDSRTTAKTKVPEIMKTLHRPYISRDVFLDHSPDVPSVKKAVVHAVKIAKKYGYVIAIGHPHKNTLKGLVESKEVLKQVRLVHIDELADYLKR